MQLDEREWSEDEGAVEELAEGRYPVVFAFRPTKFMRVAPEKLRD